MMRRLLVPCLLFAALPAAAAGPSPPRRVASLNLSADEVLVEILPPERLVSVTRWADEVGTSNIVGRVPRSVFRIHKVDMERLVALAPDLVVVSEYTDVDFLRLLERSGMRWHRMEGLNSIRSEEHTSELQSRLHLVWHLLLEKKNNTIITLIEARIDV